MNAKLRAADKIEPTKPTAAKLETDIGFTYFFAQ